MKFYKNIIALLLIILTMSGGKAWADSYTITFSVCSNNCRESDDMSEATTTVECSTIVSSGSEYLSGNVAAATRAYYGGKYGLKLGSSKYGGSIKMNLSALGQVTPTSIVISARPYSSETTYTLSVNGSATQTIASNTNYTYTITSDITYLELISSKRLWIQSITVNYTAGVSHTLSSAVDPAASGTVVLGATSVSEGSTTTATATPNSGYGFSYWSITGAGASLSSTTDNPTTVTMGTEDAVVTAHFVELVPYTVSFSAGTGTCSTTSLTETIGGGGVSLPEAIAPSGCDPEYSFYGWSETSISETASAPTIVGSTGDTYYPAANITLYAVYVAGGYEKVSSTLSDWSGTYLIVYDGSSKAFDGSLTTLDAAGNNISVSAVNGVIASTATTDASSFVIASGYTIKSSSGYYVGRTSDSNGLDTSQNPEYTNTISYNGVSVDIISSAGAYLRFNTSDNRFRYYKSSSYTGQQAIQLYRKTSSSTFSSSPSCTCPSPSDFSVSGITSATANLSWTANGTESQWQVVLSETDLDDPSTGTINVSSTTSYTATGLTPLTTYYAYVRAKCADDDFSSWKELGFTTTCVDWSDAFAINITSASLEPAGFLNLSVSGNTSGRDGHRATVLLQQ